MNNRGSISVEHNATAKEQRVNGGKQRYNFSCLNRTLMNLEINYQIKYLSNQLAYKKFYSSLTTQQSQIKLKPSFITGFTDGEACFSIVILKNPQIKIG